jgi:hypothetical protein
LEQRKLATSTQPEQRDSILKLQQTTIVRLADDHHNAEIDESVANMAALNSVPTMKSGGSAPVHSCHTSRPSITKEEIQKVEQEIVEAEKMIKGAVGSHKAKTFEREQAAFKKIRESKEFQGKVEAFRWELVSPLET